MSTEMKRKRVRRKYGQVTEGEWVQPMRRDYRLVCCDCKLVHRFQFRIVDRHIQMRAWRDDRATSQLRRHHWRKTIGLFAHWLLKEKAQAGPHDG